MLCMDDALDIDIMFFMDDAQWFFELAPATSRSWENPSQL